MRRYRSTLEKEAAVLTGWVARMAVEVEHGRITAAQSRYAAARVPFGHLYPLLLEFPDLNIRLDAEWDERQRRLTGFHEVERLLWTEQPRRLRQRATRQLFLDVKKLQEKAKATALDPGTIARRINEVLSGAVLRALGGDEEPYAHIDLLDISAHVEGVESAYRAIKPLVAESDPGLAKRIRSGFDDFHREIRDFGIPAVEPDQPRAQAPGVSFVIYSEVSSARLERLQSVLNQLIRPLAKVPAALEPR